MKTSSLTSDVSRLVGEAAEWRLLSLLFECPVGDWHEQAAALAEEIIDADLEQAARRAQQEACEGLYHAALGPGRAAAPREVSCRDAIQPGQFLAELQAFYQAFAYQPATREAPDHVSTEAGFISYLKLKEAFALSNGQDEKAAVTAEAAAHFLEEHLAAMAEPLARSLDSCGVDYLSLAAAALVRRVGPSPGVCRGPGPMAESGSR
ncbi:MAG: molecular chaperone TorD family protein [Planctomycetota bacterium]|jgi:nitrate reductase assembly molybdenum cofactor insertion protein NarJ